MPHGLPGLFIALEGGDGAGKSTQAALLHDALQAGGRTVVRTREPGGTPIGEELRSLVLDHGHGEIDARTEALMFAASRSAHVHQVILPALRRGDVVVCARYIDSSVAYQGTGRGLGAESVLQLNFWATDGLRPDLTVLLDVAPAEGRSRRTSGTVAEDRLESEPDAFHTSIRSAFLELAAAEPSRYLVLAASGAAEEIHRAVLRALAGATA
ncbi:thymidylate kinase [Arthrobacter sp. RIT-PI-e]|nr:thymidylate kinase [Arthrobacter sp. RIT-PI-e]